MVQPADRRLATEAKLAEGLAEKADLDDLTTGLSTKVNSIDPRLSDARAATDASVAALVTDSASATESALRVAYGPGGTAGNVSTTTAAGIAAGMALVFGG